jgi:hypothetical protein
MRRAARIANLRVVIGPRRTTSFSLACVMVAEWSGLFCGNGYDVERSRSLLGSDVTANHISTSTLTQRLKLTRNEQNLLRWMIAAFSGQLM